MAATLTKDMLADLSKGNACFKVIPQTYTITDTSFDTADKFYTTKDSLAIGGGTATIAPIKVDQEGGITIGETVDYADVTIAGSIPSTAIEVFDYLFTESSAAGQPALTTGITGDDGTTKYTEATGYDLNGAQKAVTILVESDSKNCAIIFLNVTLVAGAPALSNVQSTPWTVPFNGIAKAATTAGKPSFIILKKA